MDPEIHTVCMFPAYKPNKLFIFLFLRLECGTSACARCVGCLSLHVDKSGECTLIMSWDSFVLCPLWWSGSGGFDPVFACVGAALVWLVTTVCFLLWQTKSSWSWIHCMMWFDVQTQRPDGGTAGQQYDCGRHGDHLMASYEKQRNRFNMNG